MRPHIWSTVCSCCKLSVPEGLVCWRRWIPNVYNNLHWRSTPFIYRPKIHLRLTSSCCTIRCIYPPQESSAYLFADSKATRVNIAQFQNRSEKPFISLLTYFVCYQQVLDTALFRVRHTPGPVVFWGGSKSSFKEEFRQGFLLLIGLFRIVFQRLLVLRRLRPFSIE